VVWRTAIGRGNKGVRDIIDVMTDKQYSVGIIGGGGVGLTLAALLSDVAEVIVKVRRPEQAEAINAQGINFTLRNGQETLFKNVRAVVDFADLKDCDAVIVAVKSYDTAAVAGELNGAIGADATVLTLQNGLQAYGVLREGMEHPDRVFAGVTYVAASRIDDRTVVNGDNLRVVIDDKAVELVKIMKQTRFTTEVSAEINQAVWDKMVLNAGQNALSAVTNLNFGEMVESAECLDLTAKLLGEFEQVAEAEGVTFNYSFMEAIRNNWKGSTFYPSMWQDLHKGRRTEIDAINGAICELGKKHDLATPYNDMITSLIKALEVSSRKSA
jgi:2-dehydropantoate 2-reductase